MDRQKVYAGAIPLETDILLTNKNAMIGLAKLTAAILGTGTHLNALTCVPTGPASLNVVVNPGEIYKLANVDSTAYSSVPLDNTHQVVKQGILMDAVTLSCPAPGTGGFSINYLVQVTFQETDGGSTLLEYYNASDPTSPWSGPGNDGVPDTTVRQDKCVVAVKAGTAAATGTQTTPAADSGYVGAYVVTVANGQTAINSGDISVASGAPFITETLLQKLGQSEADARYLQIVNARILLSTPLSLYVSPSGNDSNNGLTSGTPFLTIEHAWDVLASQYDLGGNAVTINLAHGTYTAGLATAVALVGGGGVTIVGDTGSPSSVIVSVTAGNSFTAMDGVVFTVSGMQLQATGSGVNGFALNALRSGTIIIGPNIIFGACDNAHRNSQFGGQITALNSFTISGGSGSHIAAHDAGKSFEAPGITVTLTGTPAFSTAFANVFNGGNAKIAGITFSGSATGPRYSAAVNGVIDTGGGGATYLPGNAGGSTATGGQYV